MLLAFQAGCWCLPLAGPTCMGPTYIRGRKIHAVLSTCKNAENYTIPVICFVVCVWGGGRRPKKLRSSLERSTADFKLFKLLCVMPLEERAPAEQGEVQSIEVFSVKIWRGHWGEGKLLSVQLPPVLFLVIQSQWHKNFAKTFLFYTCTISKLILARHLFVPLCLCIWVHTK